MGLIFCSVLLEIQANNLPRTDTASHGARGGGGEQIRAARSTTKGKQEASLEREACKKHKHSGQRVTASVQPSSTSSLQLCVCAGRRSVARIKAHSAKRSAWERTGGKEQARALFGVRYSAECAAPVSPSTQWRPGKQQASRDRGGRKEHQSG